MILVLLVLLATGATGWAPVPCIAAPADESTAYRDQSAVEKTLRDLARSEKRIQVIDLATTAGDRKLQLLEIRPGKDIKDREDAAVLVFANPLGTTPLATEAALRLARMLAEPAPAGDGGRRAHGLTWYIVPSADPDGAARYFDRPLLADGRNGRAVDDDKDGASGEDGPDDLNGDGLITTMLLPHPQGRWLLTEDDPPLPKEADPAKGEVGLYRRLVEGRDDDGDGRFNEDGPGGVVPGRNFPHAFEHWTAGAGRWAASEPESRALLQFAFDHPEIALVLVFGQTNTLAKVPESDREAEVGGGKYRLPEWMSKRLGLDPEQKFPLDELVQMGRDFTGRKDLTAEDVMQFLDLGAAVNPNRRDLAWWNELSEKYKEFLKEVDLDGPRVDPRPSVPGSVEEWAYFQYGVPAFALDFWSVPKPAETGGEGGEAGAADGADGTAPTPLTPDDVEKMDRDTFIALGEEKIGAFLKANDAPAHITPTMVVKALQGGMLTPAKVAEMMRKQAEKKEAEGVDPDLKALAMFSAERLDGRGYRDWSKATLPDGRQVQIGGAVPFALRTPPAALVDSLLSAQLPFLLRLADWLPRLAIAAVELDFRGADVYEVKVHIGNEARISYPTAQGLRCRRPPPVVVTLEGVEILEGRARQTIKQVPALGAASRRWLVRGQQGGKLTIEMTTPSAGRDSETIVLERDSRTIDLKEKGGQR